MLPLFKKIISLLVLTSFLVIVFLGLFTMVQGSDGRFSADCPLSAMGDSSCPQDIIAAGFHHLSSYYSFLNVPLPAVTLIVLFIFLLITAVVQLLVINLPVPVPLVTVGQYNSALKFDFHRKKVTDWLSLFENSPSSY